MVKQSFCAIIGDPQIGDKKTDENFVISKIIDEFNKINYDENVKFVFVVGDVTMHGLREEFELFRELIDQNLKKPFYIIPGNHDICESLPGQQKIWSENDLKIFFRTNSWPFPINLKGRKFFNCLLEYENSQFLVLDNVDREFAFKKNYCQGLYPKMHPETWRFAYNYFFEENADPDNLTIFSHYPIPWETLAKFSVWGRKEKARTIRNIHGHFHLNEHKRKIVPINWKFGKNNSISEVEIEKVCIGDLISNNALKINLLPRELEYII